MMTLGKGNIKVAAWSQMHGNESTATLAMLDLLAIFEKHPELKEKLFELIQLDFIFMLNPDGSEAGQDEMLLTSISTEIS
jgi:murein tripeptide amidase MpaA